MTYDELLSANPVVAIDDVHHAQAVLGGVVNMQPEFRMFRIAQMLAALRANYIEIGRAVEAGSCKNEND